MIIWIILVRLSTGMHIFCLVRYVYFLSFLPIIYNNNSFTILFLIYYNFQCICCLDINNKTKRAFTTLCTVPLCLFYQKFARLLIFSLVRLCNYINQPKDGFLLTFQVSRLLYILKNRPVTKNYSSLWTFYHFCWNSALLYLNMYWQLMP